MAFRLPDRWGCVGLLTFLFAPGLVLGYLTALYVVDGGHAPWFDKKSEKNFVR